VSASPTQGELFGPAAAQQPVLPDGLRYTEDFLGVDEHDRLLALLRGLPVQEAVYKGYTARRRTVHYGGAYDYDDNRLLPAPPIADFLLPLRQRLADWSGIAAERFVDALVSEYRPGTPLGWHRDVPDFEVVVGVSLAGEARMRWRPWPPVQPKKDEIVTLALAPRSAYLMQGTARWGWQHSIAPTPGLRYSITFRTRRNGRGTQAV
jgi:alkylated DNA repair dioxygenase AlkB